jgi:hypothetical protein
MPHEPFLPGLIFAAAAWIVSLLYRLAPEKLIARALARAEFLRDWSPWIYSIGLPYLALLLGWISARDYGLTGQTLLEWLLGIVLAAVLGALLGRVSARLAETRGWSDVRAETRWTLYRAAAGPWTGNLPAAVGVGLAAAAGEYLWRKRPAGEPLFPMQGIVFLVRAGGSGLLFLLAHNFFAAMLFYFLAALTAREDVWARVAALVRKADRPSRGDEAPR